MVVGKIYRANLGINDVQFNSFVICLSLDYHTFWLNDVWVTVKVLTEKGIIGFFTTTHSTLSVFFEEL